MENSTEFTTNPHHELQQKLLYFLQNTVQTAGGIIVCLSGGPDRVQRGFRLQAGNDLPFYVRRAEVAEVLLRSGTFPQDKQRVRKTPCRVVRAGWRLQIRNELTILIVGRQQGIRPS